jgi:hypothetical protein
VVLVCLVRPLVVLVKARLQVLVSVLAFSLVLAVQLACQMLAALNISGSWSVFVQWVSADNHVKEQDATRAS